MMLPHNCICRRLSSSRAHRQVELVEDISLCAQVGDEASLVDLLGQVHDASQKLLFMLNAMQLLHDLKRLTVRSSWTNSSVSMRGEERKPAW